MLNKSYKKTCKVCLYDESHPLGIIINEQGICSGCLIHKEKDIIDWEERFNSLEKNIKEYRSNSSTNYDCIVPVSGSGQSFYILHLLKEKLKLNPLLVSYNHYFNTKIGIRNLSNLRTVFDSDILIQNINIQSVKKIIKTTFRELNSIYWHVIAGQTAFPVQIAITNKIPLIIWGAHQGIEQVGMFSHFDEVEMTRRYRKEHDLMGYEADDLLSKFDILKEEDIWRYRYPDELDISNIGVKGIYLGNYFRWDPKIQHEFVIKNYNYKTLNHERTFYSYDHVDCFNYMNLHDILKFIKHGFSKVTDHACREIRHGRLKRKEAEKIVSYYQGVKPKYLNLFCNWLGINEVALNQLLINIYNDINYKKNIKNRVRNIDDIFKNDKNSEKKEKYKKDNFINSSEIVLNENDEYILFGKEYP